MKSKKYLILFMAVVLAIGLVAVGCGSSTTTTKAPATTATTGGTATTATTAGGAATTTTAAAKAVEVKIGAAGPFTGQLAKIGQDTLNVIKYAVEQYNASQTKVKVTVDDTGDDAADPAKAAAVAEKFSSDAAIMGVIGPMTSAGILAALPVLEKGKLAMITQSGTNDQLSQQGFTVFHRVCPVDAAQGGAVAGIIGADLKAKKVYIIDDKGTYGQGLADQVIKALKEKYKYTDDAIARVSVTPDDKDFNALITKMKAFAPDALFFSNQSPAQYAALAKQMAQANYKVQLVGADGVKEKGEFIDNAAGATEGCLFTSLGPILETSAVPAAVELVKVWTTKYGAVSMFTGASFEATNVMLDAFTRAYDANGGKVTRDGVNAALKTTNYTGILGFPIKFQPNGDLVSSGVYIGEVKGGQFVAVKSADY